MAKKLKFLFLEPFFGGSHRDFAEGLVAHSRHSIDLVTLPARFWKWRMRGAAITFARKIGSLKGYDGLVLTDLMSLADFKALMPPPFPPSLVYFHENQLTYPLAPGERMDYQFGFTGLTTALAATRILFNSHFHKDAFFDQMPAFLNMMPEYVPGWTVDTIRERSAVCYPGCHFPMELTMPEDRASIPLIIWNHRWEFDKNPDGFFAALQTLVEKGVAFELAILGENFQAVPKAFIRAREQFNDRIRQYGYEAKRDDYEGWLRQGHVVVSTAEQENFGIAIVEAIRWGCFPILPKRLVYPEIIPEVFHKDCLYNSHKDMVDKLYLLLTEGSPRRDQRMKLSEAMAKFSWDTVIEAYDEELEKLASGEVNWNLSQNPL